MSASRQARRQLGRSLKAAGRAPLHADEISLLNSELSAASEDVKLAAGRCAACLSTSGERKSCHACGFVRYCNRECQVAGWPSHKLICRVLAADREIAASPKLSASAPLLPLATIWERLRSGSHAEASEAAAHMRVWAARCSPRSAPAASGPELERRTALRDEIAAAGGIALLVPGLAVGGMRAATTATALSMLAYGHPETGAAILATGALPPLIYALKLPSTHPEFRDIWSLRVAAECAAVLIEFLCSGAPWLAKDIAGTEGAIPALILHLKFIMREDVTPPPHWPARYRDLSRARVRAIGAITGLVSHAEVDNEIAWDCSVAAPSTLGAAMGCHDVDVASAAAECLAFLISQSHNVPLACQLGSNPSKIVDIIRGGGSRESATFLLKEIVRLAPECRTAADALSAAVALRASPADARGDPRGPDGGRGRA